VISLASGLEIAYDDAGSGLPGLFIHGFPHDRTLWLPQLGALVVRARCIAPDLRGFGASTTHGPYSMDRYADDLASLLDALRIERAVVCGLSMGGYVAFAFWRRHRARARALVLCDTRAGADDDEGRARRDALIALAREKGVDAVARAMMVNMVGASTRERHPGVVEAMYAMLASAPLDGVVGALEALRDRPDSRPTLATIDVPTLILVGDEDTLTPPAESRAMHAAIASSRLELVAGAGHVSNVERPAAFNHLLSEFLATVEYE
jgi:pimeloyl-ACP methyl ester carboxylesterase